MLQSGLSTDIQCVMGDRFHSYPGVLAQEVIQQGSREKLIRDEIYCQLIKQTSENPQYRSELNGMKLIYLCLSSFLPSAELEPYVRAHLARKAVQVYAYDTTISFETIEDVATHCFGQLCRQKRSQDAIGSVVREYSIIPSLDFIKAVFDQSSSTGAHDSPFPVTEAPGASYMEEILSGEPVLDARPAADDEMERRGSEPPPPNYDGQFGDDMYDDDDGLPPPPPPQILPPPPTFDIPLPPTPLEVETAPIVPLAEVGSQHKLSTTSIGLPPPPPEAPPAIAPPIEEEDVDQIPSPSPPVAAEDDEKKPETVIRPPPNLIAPPPMFTSDRPRKGSHSTNRAPIDDPAELSLAQSRQKFIVDSNIRSLHSRNPSSDTLRTIRPPPRS